jgi:hypothetical protein
VFEFADVGEFATTRSASFPTSRLPGRLIAGKGRSVDRVWAERILDVQVVARDVEQGQAEENVT